MAARALPMIAARYVIVHGRVQGVGFRYFAQKVGSRLGLVGDVRNRGDGTVEIVVEGDETALGDFLREVATGPRGARVDHVETRPIPATGTFQRFGIEGWQPCKS